MTPRVSVGPSTVDGQKLEPAVIQEVVRTSYPASTRYSSSRQKVTYPLSIARRTGY
jgi:hypothetical protein